MSTCEFCEEEAHAKPVTRSPRPRLFNWMTVLLVFAWVSIVTAVLEYTHGDRVPATTEAMVETLTR